MKSNRPSWHYVYWDTPLGFVCDLVGKINLDDFVCYLICLYPRNLMKVLRRFSFCSWTTWSIWKLCWPRDQWVFVKEISRVKKKLAEACQDSSCFIGRGSCEDSIVVYDVCCWFCLWLLQFIEPAPQDLDFHVHFIRFIPFPHFQVMPLASLCTSHLLLMVDLFRLFRLQRQTFCCDVPGGTLLNFDQFCRFGMILVAGCCRYRNESGMILDDFGMCWHLLILHDIAVNDIMGYLGISYIHFIDPSWLPSFIL